MLSLGKPSQQEQPLYATSYMGFYIRIYPNRIEFKVGIGGQSIPLGQIASVQVGPVLFSQIVLETTGGQKYTIPTKRKKEVKQAIYDAQSRFLNTGNASQSSAADEIAKLHDLMQKGVISQEEFEGRKKQLLG